jgi:hypothetical protein
VRLAATAPKFEAGFLLRCRSRLEVVDAYCNQLDAAEQQQNNNNNENQSQPAARSVTPGTAVIPSWQRAHQKQNQEND